MQLGAQAREQSGDGLAAGTPDDVTDEEDPYFA
jgi:hypothetical protein